MEISETKKTNKYVPLVTYCIAVVCLILGLFLPLWDGKEILALQLPDALNNALSKEIISAGKEFSLPFPIDLFGLGKINFDIMAWVVLLYAAVTVLAVIALIPVILCSVKDKPSIARGFAYIVETAAVLVLSLYVVLALELYPQYLMPLLPPLYQSMDIGYNMIIALGGSLITLIVLNILSKKGSGVLKTVLFLLSAVGVIALFDLGVLIPSLADKLKVAFMGADGGSTSGINYLQILFNSSYSEQLSFAPDTKAKAAIVLSTILGLAVLVNYIIEVVSLSTNTKKIGRLFNVVRYGVEVAAAVALLITVAVCKYTIGIMLIAIAAVAVIALAISVLRLLLSKKKAAVEDTVYDDESDEEPQDFTPPAYPQQPRRSAPAYNNAFRREQPAAAQPAPAEIPAPAEVQPAVEEQPSFFDKSVEVPVTAEPVIEHRAEPEYNVYPRMIGQTKPEREVKPVQPAKTMQPVQPVQPVQPAQTVLPAYPAQPVSEPAVETRIYTINTIYGGPTDDFIKKLTNDEKIEFARTFIEKNNGVIGNIPDYVIGGNNRMFFSSVFIYLGRIRGMISDSLLNKMYRELNMM